jgi:hypothetical protein
MLSDPVEGNVGDITHHPKVTCSKTCSTSAEMSSEGVAHCPPKTGFSAIYDPEIVS